MVEERAAQFESRYDSLQEETLRGVFLKCKEVDSSIDLILKVVQGKAASGSLTRTVWTRSKFSLPWTLTEVELGSSQPSFLAHGCSWCDEHNELMSPGHCQGGRQRMKAYQEFAEELLSLIALDMSLDCWCSGFLLKLAASLLGGVPFFLNGLVASLRAGGPCFESQTSSQNPLTIVSKSTLSLG